MVVAKPTPLIQATTQGPLVQGTKLAIGNFDPFTNRTIRRLLQLFNVIQTDKLPQRSQGGESDSSLFNPCPKPSGRRFGAEQYLSLGAQIRSPPRAPRVQVGKMQI
ncbi:hypothetical protein AXFE_13370 [Acidithrix ferrooxidans]|uniref:Uncharacterized protein n=1 Tax=Acidithrix ferrooxidans TaxID=1280514 RepID=A0A0D8HIR7_9ACTN|nr:hypothetical protein AXFE_13370 [Acidithrix ferrooxidans]